jgi:hypothetical protein
MSDRLAMERLAKEKVRAALTARANAFVEQFTEQSLADIAGPSADPFGYLAGFSSDARWLAGEVDSNDDSSLENVIRYALTRGFVLGMLYQNSPR